MIGLLVYVYAIIDAAAGRELPGCPGSMERPWRR